MFFPSTLLVTEIELGHGARQQARLPTEPSCWPSGCFNSGTAAWFVGPWEMESPSASKTVMLGWQSA